MKATILSENITNYIPLLGKLLSSHSQLPILSNIFIEAGKEGLRIRATDLEMGGEILIPAKVDEEGSVTIPGKEFAETITTLPKDKIVMTTEKDMMILTCRGNKISFNTIPAQEFPQLFKEKGVVVVKFTRKEFENAFSYLSFSASSEETRPQLTGVYIDEKDGGVNFVSTDGYRMSVKKYVSAKKVSGGLIVAVGLIDEVMTLKSGEDISLYINKEENQTIFEVGNVVLLGRMIEGQFPDYEKVIPSDARTVVRFEREELLRNVKLASVFARDSGNIINLEIIGESMRLTTRSQGVGEGEMLIDCVKTGEDNKISFNSKYLMDLLKTVSEETIELRLNSASEPAVFEVKEQDFTHVIMPIQVD